VTAFGSEGHVTHSVPVQAGFAQTGAGSDESGIAGPACPGFGIELFEILAGKTTKRVRMRLEIINQPH
jgi:hypothetical protein